MADVPARYASDLSAELSGIYLAVAAGTGNTLVWVFLHGVNVVSIDSGDVPRPLRIYRNGALDRF